LTEGESQITHGSLFFVSGQLLFITPSDFGFRASDFRFRSYRGASIGSLLTTTFVEAHYLQASAARDTTTPAQSSNAAAPFVR